MPLVKACPVCSRLSARLIASWLAQWPRRSASWALARLARPARWLALSASLAPSLAAESLRSCWQRLCRSLAQSKGARARRYPGLPPLPARSSARPPAPSLAPYLRPGAWRAGRPGAYPAPYPSPATPLVGLVELCRDRYRLPGVLPPAGSSSSPSAPPSVSLAPLPNERVSRCQVCSHLGESLCGEHGAPWSPRSGTPARWPDAPAGLSAPR